MKQQEWQPIETAPKDGSSYLLLDNEIAAKSVDDAFYFIGYWSEDEMCWCGAETETSINEAFVLTHWMPLPDPPEGSR